MYDLDQMLREQIVHAYQNAPAIRQLLQDAGVHPRDIQAVRDLERIPVLTKDRLQQMQEENPPFGGFLAVPIGVLKRIYISPGPIYDPHGYAEAQNRQNMEEAFTECGFSAHDRVVNTFMYHMVPAGLLMDEALTSIGATVVPMGPGNTEVQIRVIADLDINSYVGTPSFLDIILNKAADMRVDLPLEKAFFSAEPFTRVQREKFERYGIKCAQVYATADLGLIAYEPSGVAGMYVPRNLIVQICSPETGEELPYGEVGEAVVTTFSRSYPLVRFGTGDLSMMEMEMQPDGTVRQKLRGILGRSGEAVKVRGMFLHPNSLKQAATHFDNIQQMQAIVANYNNRDHVTLQVVLSGGSLDTDALRKAVEQAARLSIDQVEVVREVEGSRIVRDTRSYV